MGGFLCFFNNCHKHSHSEDIQPRRHDIACIRPKIKTKSSLGKGVNFNSIKSNPLFLLLCQQFQI